MSQIDKAEKNARNAAIEDRTYRGRAGCHRVAAARGKVDARRGERRVGKLIVAAEVRGGGDA